MEESILKSTKKILNVGVDDDSFDLDIITHINAAFSHLQTLGIGPKAGFVILDADAEWGDFLPAPDPVPDNYLPILSAVKTNVALRVRLVFDPPQMSSVLTALQSTLDQSDWRLNVLREETDWVNPDPPVVIVDGEEMP
jgi:hypothetical protein